MRYRPAMMTGLFALGVTALAQAHAEFHPFSDGFDEFFGFTHEGHYFVPPPWHGVDKLASP